jgi:hypothetical protein
MSYRTTVLAQVLGGLDAKEFARCAARHPMRRTPSAISAYDHFATMVFAQLTYRESLRDIEACLEARRQLLYHSGIRGKVKRCNLAYANTQRDWHVFAEVAAVLMRRAHRLYVDQPPEPDLPFGLFALDATLIELSLALFPWARWQSTHAAVKLNVLLDLRTDIPVFASIHEGSRHEVASLDEIPVQPDSFYVIDRGYMDFQRLHRLHAAKAFFVIRSKCNLRFYVVESRKVDKTTGVRCDQTIRLNFRKSREHYPETLRRIRYFDAESGLSLVFLTNAFHLPALTIAEIYRRRWQIGVSRQGHVFKSVKVRPGPIDSGPVAREAPLRESTAVKPSSNMLSKGECAKYPVVSRMNAEVASSHAVPVAEMVDNMRKQQVPIETSPMRRRSPAGYQRRQGTNEDVETGEALDVRRRNSAEEALAITVSGKCRCRHQGDGSGRSTVDGRAAKRARREGPGPVGMTLVEARQG